MRYSINEIPEGTSLCGTASFDISCIKIDAVVLAVGNWKNQKTSRVHGKQAKSRMRRNETAYPIWMKFCMLVGIPTKSPVQILVRIG